VAVSAHNGGEQRPLTMRHQSTFSTEVHAIRAKAERFRRLARAVLQPDVIQMLQTYADELDARASDLERRATIPDSAA
jgi:hypothetical protein